MFKFIHTADIHLDSPLEGLEAHEDAPVEEIRGATRKAFAGLIELALEEEIDFILIAGDLYDGDWKDYNTGIFFASQMGRLSEAGIKAFIVSGNHDAASQITKVMPLPDNVTLFSSGKPQSVKLDDLAVIIHGQSYSSRAVTENLASQYPRFDSDYFNIGLLHTSLTGREGHENYVPCSLDDLTSRGYDYWALGHVHRREIVSDEPMILFPGNIQGRHIRETGAKSATLVTVEDGRIAGIEEREFDVIRWSVCKVDLSECESRESLYDQVRSAMEKERELADGRILALRLQLEGRSLLHAELHAHTSQITEQVRGIAASLGGVWLEKVKFGTSRKNDMEESPGEDTPLSGLLQVVENLDFSEDTLQALIPDLASLMAKLPAELVDNDSGSDTWSDNQGELRAEVRELLIAKLLQHGGEE